MGENTSQIEREIVTERAELGRNLEDLEQKAKDLTNWRVHYSNRPALFLGAAMGTGLLLGALTASARSDQPAMSRFADVPGRPLGPQSRKTAYLVNTWGDIADALLGVATAKVVDVIADYLPGFRDEYDRFSAAPPRSVVAR